MRDVAAAHMLVRWPAPIFDVAFMSLPDFDLSCEVPSHASVPVPTFLKPFGFSSRYKLCISDCVSQFTFVL